LKKEIEKKERKRERESEGFPNSREQDETFYFLIWQIRVLAIGNTKVDWTTFRKKRRKFS